MDIVQIAIFGAVALMLIPGLNVFAGLILGALLGGLHGAIVGLALGIALTMVAAWISNAFDRTLYPGIASNPQSASPPPDLAADRRSLSAFVDAGQILSGGKACA
jgi:hypothetical protein